MKSKKPRDPEIALPSRVLIGAIAGIAGTLAMTAAMRRMHQRLPPKEQYPLTPREIIDSAAEQAGLPLEIETAKDVTTAGHFLYGAASGALLGAANVMMGPVSGATGGLTIWLTSYLGWIPGANILKPATQHPARRNLLMLTAHVVWGVATARAMREIVAARETMLEQGADEDAPPEGRSS